ncbi:hypothetical protein [Nonomuraea sp. NPDC052265]|uniref:hypothetical protein n=1 Tax=Nonomuraea sp. NPDC052265 TaxID=3364374 RepID=UPI0037C8E755
MSSTIDKIAWIHLDNGKILSTRSRGKNAYYIPGGKREPGETDLEPSPARPSRSAPGLRQPDGPSRRQPGNPSIPSPPGAQGVDPDAVPAELGGHGLGPQQHAGPGAGQPRLA